VHVSVRKRIKCPVPSFPKLDKTKIQIQYCLPKALRPQIQCDCDCLMNILRL